MYLSTLTAEAVLDFATPIAKWVTLGIAAALVILGILFFVLSKTTKRPTLFSAYAKYAAIGFFSFLLLLAVAFFAVDITKTYTEDASEETMIVIIPSLVFATTLLLALASYAITDKFFPRAKKIALIVGLSLAGAALVAILVCLIVFYNQNIAGNEYYNSNGASVKQVALYLSAAACAALLIGVAFTDRQKLSFDARSIAYAGVCAGMSYALSYIKLWDVNPQGGSVTLVSLLPIMVYAYIFGVKKGIFVGFVYGVLQATQDPYVIHLAQFFLDYPIAFASCGLAGLLKKVPFAKKAPQLSFALGATIGGTMRYICHVLSGVLAFEAFAIEEGQTAWIYSLSYNVYVFVDVALVIVAGVIIFSSKAFLRAVQKAEHSAQIATVSEEKNQAVEN